MTKWSFLRALSYRESKNWYRETALLIVVGNERWNLSRNNCKFWVRCTCFYASEYTYNEWTMVLQIPVSVFDCPKCYWSYYRHRLSKPWEKEHDMYTPGHSDSNPKIQCLNLCFLCTTQFLSQYNFVAWVLTRGDLKNIKNSKWNHNGGLLGYVWSPRA